MKKYFFLLSALLLTGCSYVVLEPSSEAQMKVQECFNEGLNTRIKKLVLGTDNIEEAEVVECFK